MPLHPLQARRRWRSLAGALVMGVGLLGMAEPHASASQTPASAARMLREGIALLDQNELDKAQARFEQLLTAGLKTPDAYYYLGIIHERRGDLSAAVSAFEAALKQEPRMARAHDRLGFVLGQQGRTVEAVEHFREAVRLDPKLADAHYHLGATLWWMKEPANALTALRRAAELRPDHPEAQYYLGVVLREARRHYGCRPASSTRDPSRPLDRGGPHAARSGPSGAW